MEEKARLIKQKNELTNLMKTVENNVEPKRFKAMRGGSNNSGVSSTFNNNFADQLLDFDGGMGGLTQSNNL